MLIWLSEETDLSETKTTTDQGIQQEQQFLVPGKAKNKGRCPMVQEPAHLPVIRKPLILKRSSVKGYLIHSASITKECVLQTAQLRMTIKDSSLSKQEKVLFPKNLNSYSGASTTTATICPVGKERCLLPYDRERIQEGMV